MNGFGLLALVVVMLSGIAGLAIQRHRDWVNVTRETES